MKLDFSRVNWLMFLAMCVSFLVVGLIYQDYFSYNTVKAYAIVLVLIRLLFDIGFSGALFRKKIELSPVLESKWANSIEELEGVRKK